MKLLTKEILSKLPVLYATESVPLADRRVAVKFFTPWTNWTWYAVEGSPDENGDMRFFGFVEGQENEWGYFMLSDLQSIKGPFGLKIERDRHFDGKLPASVRKAESVETR